MRGVCFFHGGQIQSRAQWTKEWSKIFPKVCAGESYIYQCFLEVIDVAEILHAMWIFTRKIRHIFRNAHSVDSS